MLRRQTKLRRSLGGSNSVTYAYTYDAGGNLLTETVNGTVNTYVYDSVWKDKLLSYNGKAITYDAAGHPLNYMGSTMTWDVNDRLTTISDASASGNGGNIVYTYLSDGSRRSKTVGGVTTTYHYNNGLLLSQTTGDETLYFYYDSTGNVTSMGYKKGSADEAGYFFTRNAQGDIIGVYRSSDSKLIGTYEYDLWGRPVSVTEATAGIDTDGILTKNPFRYRGYYYDEETGFYYLNARYYDPVVRRFISADDITYLGVDGTVNTYNIFTYCENNPINLFDDNGNFSLPNWAKVTVGAVATVAAVAVTFATGGAALPVLIGVAASTIGGAATGAIKHRVTTGSWDGAGKAAVDGAADGFMTGGLCAFGGSVIGGAARTIKNARSGITIGKMGQFEKVAEIAKTQHYSGLKEFEYIEKTLGTKAAETVGWWQNKCVVKGVMALKGAIYDCGGELTGAYAKEVALTKGYQYLYNVWLM